MLKLKIIFLAFASTGFWVKVYIRHSTKMEKSPSNGAIDGIVDSQSDNISFTASPELPSDYIGSLLTPTVNLLFSKSHDPSQWLCLKSIFETLSIFEEVEEADYYDSAGNEPPFLKDHEFNHFEVSIDELPTGKNSMIPSISKFVFLSDEVIDSSKKIIDWEFSPLYSRI